MRITVSDYRLWALRGHLMRWSSSLLLGGAVITGAALSQTASQLTQRDFAPDVRSLQGQLVFSGQPGLSAPPGAEDLAVRIAGVSVEGSLPGMDDETAILEARLTRGRIRVAEIFEAASGLEASYAAAGYVLARVVLPAQTLTDGGDLRIVVVNGFIEGVDLSSVPEAVRQRIASVTAPLEDRRGLMLSEIERRLLLAGDTYGVALGSALAAGAQPAGTVLVLDPEFRSVTGFLGFGNLVPDGAGSLSVDAGVEFNSLLGFGEVIYGQLSGGRQEFVSSEPALRTFALGAIVPLGADGLTFNLEGTVSEQRNADERPISSSTFERLSARVYYPWVRSRTMNLTTQFSLDAQEDRLWIETSAGDIDIYEDRLRVLRLAGDGFWQTGEGVTTEAGAMLSIGIDGMGARSAADATPSLPLSRFGADADFTALEISARQRRPIGRGALLTLSARGQTSFGDPLSVSEQIGIANARELSTLDTGSLSGDSGWVMRGEIAYPIPVKWSNLVIDFSPYAFAAAGGVGLEEPQVGESRWVGANAYGIGLDVFYAADPNFSNATLRVEVGRGERDDDKGDDGTRFTFTGNVRF